MAKVFKSLQRLTNAGASILFTHHHRKQMGFVKGSLGDKMRGSSDILAAVDCHVTIEKKSDSKHLVLRQNKLRQGEPLGPFEIKIIKNGSDLSGFEYAGEHDDKKSKAQEVAEVVVEVLMDGPKSRPEILEMLAKGRFGKTATDDGIKIAEEQGKIERVPTTELPPKERKAFYRIKKDLPDSQIHMNLGNQEDAEESSDSPPEGPLTYGS